MNNESQLSISVRDLINFILREGNLDSRFQGYTRAVKGTRAHQVVQEKAQKTYDYSPEIEVEYTLIDNEIEVTVTGIADGIIKEEDIIIIDEIKTVTCPLSAVTEDYNEKHWAQVKCYAYIYAEKETLKEVEVQLTYCQLESKETRKYKKRYTLEELKNFFNNLVEKYLNWIRREEEWAGKRDESIKKLDFPHSKFRSGQRKLAEGVYKTIYSEKNLFAEAPTGIGKTIAVLFSAVKALGEGFTEKIFYLTAKNTTKGAAEEAVNQMAAEGLKLKSVTITAKEKICFKEETNCTPEDCRYARGHFDRINEALKDILEENNQITPEIIEEYAQEYKVCPFEFSLDITLWADCVICDYNYVFDPRVYLRRFFINSKGDYTFLVDEAHNLVDRAREMFSAALEQDLILKLLELFKSKENKFVQPLIKINNLIKEKELKLKKKDFFLFKEEQEGLYPLLEKFMEGAEEWLIVHDKTEEGYELLLDFYFEVLSFLNIAELYDERYTSYIERRQNNIIFKLFCFDPSYQLKEALDRGKTGIFFSATLTPLNYFKEVLGGREEDYSLRLLSPFPEDNLCLLINNKISTKYKFRQKSYQEISSYLKVLVEGQRGNYLVFFPSYEYLEAVVEIFRKDYPQIRTIAQSANMSGEERKKFLNNFKEDRGETLIGFAVLGGIFSEGIDLEGKKLVGTAVIGVGHPKLCLERNIIKDYFNQKLNRGYEYAYIYPGMNKVLQAAGRTIRSSTDKGVVMLIGERFTNYNYRNLFPPFWDDYKLVNTTQQLTIQLNQFWKK